jgi:RNA polymerase sigma-32 factor
MSATLANSQLSSTALAVASPWASRSLTLPALGNLDAYISAVNRMPMLTLEEEQSAARRLRDDNDIDAAGQLVMSHLRLVVSIARQYLGYGLPHGDLIQEGNVGLMKAVKRFDPEQGVRLVSYAMHWIKAEIHEYVLKNWRMVKVATTKAQRKLFFNLRSRKQSFRAEALDGDTHREVLSDGEVGVMAQELRVKPEEVREMEARLSGGYGPIAYLADVNHEPTAVLESAERDALATEGVARAMNELDDRSRRIVTERWLKVNDDGSGGMTLHELAAEYGVSAERVRQIEVAAMKKMRKALIEFA